jgi:hypothetical protein
VRPSKVQAESEKVEAMGENEVCDSDADTQGDSEAGGDAGGMKMKGQGGRGAGEGVARRNSEAALVVRRERDVGCEEGVSSSAASV